MGLEDIAMMAAQPGVIALSVRRHLHLSSVEAAANHKGMVYIRAGARNPRYSTDRKRHSRSGAASPQSANDALTIVAAGVTLLKPSKPTIN